MLLLVVSIILLILTYFLSVEPTIQMIKSVSDLMSEMKKAENAPLKIAKLKEQIAEWDQTRFKAGQNTELHLLIFDEISKLSKSMEVQVREIRCLNSKTDKNITVDTYDATLAGDYKSLVKTLFQIENNMKYGFVSSVSFELVKNAQTGEDDLNLRIIIQTMINN